MKQTKESNLEKEVSKIDSRILIILNKKFEKEKPNFSKKEIELISNLLFAELGEKTVSKKELKETINIICVYMILTELVREGLLKKDKNGYTRTKLGNEVFKRMKVQKK